MTTAGRSFLPDPSENTKPTSTTSPRLQAVIRCVSPVVPELRQHRVRLPGQGRHSFVLVAEIFPQPLLDRVEHVLTDREVALCRGQAKATANLGHDVNADPRTFGRGFQFTCHVFSPPGERMAQVHRWCQ